MFEITSLSLLADMVGLREERQEKRKGTEERRECIEDTVKREDQDTGGRKKPVIQGENNHTRRWEHNPIKEKTRGNYQSI